MSSFIPHTHIRMDQFRHASGLAFALSASENNGAFLITSGPIKMAVFLDSPDAFSAFLLGDASVRSGILVEDIEVEWNLESIIDITKNDLLPGAIVRNSEATGILAQHYLNGAPTLSAFPIDGDCFEGVPEIMCCHWRLIKIVGVERRVIWETNVSPE